MILLGKRRPWAREFLVSRTPNLMTPPLRVAAMARVRFLFIPSVLLLIPITGSIGFLLSIHNDGFFVILTLERWDARKLVESCKWAKFASKYGGCVHVEVSSWTVMFIFSEYYREETARLVQQLGDSRVQVATLEAQVEILTNKVEEQETVDSLYIQRLGTQRLKSGNCGWAWLFKPYQFILGYVNHDTGAHHFGTLVFDLCRTYWWTVGCRFWIGFWR